MGNEISTEETVTLYRPTGPNELKLVRQNRYTRWPPRLPGQPVFYPVTNEEYAKEIATGWNVRDGKTGYGTRFEVRKSFMNIYDEFVKSKFSPPPAGGD